MKKRHCKAFTLIEALIVVIIMAVLAATIIPQFSTSTKDAKMSNLKFNLRMVRSQLEAYKEQHSGVYPPAADSADFRNQLTQKTDQNTTLDPSQRSLRPLYRGRYSDQSLQSEHQRGDSAGQHRADRPDRQPRWLAVQSEHGWFYPNNTEYFQSTGSFANPN